MTAPRFYLDALPTSGRVDLSPQDALHAQSVLRLKIGDLVRLFDGQGCEADGTIECMGRSSVQVSITGTHAVSRELSHQLELLVALPKGDRQKVLVDLLVQLGVAQLTPLVCTRSVVLPTTNTLERLQRSVIESSKQCGRNRLMRINQPISLDGLTNEPGPTADGASADKPLKLFAHPYGSAKTLVSQLQLALNSNVNGRIAVGPEGGFTDAECQQLSQSDWIQVELGTRILRIEAAAVMIAANWAAILQR